MNSSTVGVLSVFINGSAAGVLRVSLSLAQPE